jgi:hypothetical protein
MIGNPKPDIERLKKPSKAWTVRVDELYDREAHVCQGCGRLLKRNEASPHHIKTRGAGGGDELSNLALLCGFGCHTKIDSGELIIKKEII